MWPFDEGSWPVLAMVAGVMLPLVILMGLLLYENMRLYSGRAGTANSLLAHSGVSRGHGPGWRALFDQLCALFAWPSASYDDFLKITEARAAAAKV